jgi:hypothetical protein
MSYSKAYQEVVAGRVREEEGIAFIGENKASVGRVTNFLNLASAKQPTLQQDHLRHPGVGKKGTVSNNISAYGALSVQTQ